MRRNKKIRLLLTFLAFIVVFVMSASPYADQSQGFDPQKVKLLTGADKKNKADVVKLFGEPTSKAPIQKTKEGCIELWFYTEVVLDKTTFTAKTVFLYIGFDENGSVCSAKVTEDKE